MTLVVVRALFVLVGLLFAALAVPLVRRRVPPNGRYGVRVPATLADEWVWYEANARGGAALLAVGLGVALAAVVVPHVTRLTPDALALLLAGVLLAGSVLCGVWSWWLANRLRARRQRERDG